MGRASTSRLSDGIARRKVIMASDECVANRSQISMIENERNERNSRVLVEYDRWAPGCLRITFKTKLYSKCQGAGAFDGRPPSKTASL
jgi:hypothetical protein